MKKHGKEFTKILLCISITCIFFTLITSNARSFRNYTGGSPAYGRTVEAYGTAYSMHSTPFMTYYFGTHDWIAESALLILRENRLSLPSATRNFIDLILPSIGTTGNTLLYHFLLGTEAPDGVKYPYARIRLIDCNGLTYGTSGTNFPVPNCAHHVYIDGIVPYDDPAAMAAHKCYKYIMNAFNERGWKKAAFFLGAMCHFIGDMGSYFHSFDTSIPGNPSSSEINTYMSTWNKYITWLTWRPTRFRGANQEFDFFSINLAKSMFYPSVGERPWMGTYKAALYTNEYKTWLYNQFAENQDYLFNAFTSMDNILPWTRDDFPKPTDDSYAYFKKVEDCLNYAIRYCAEVINFVSSSFIGCDCGGNSNTLPELTQTDPTTLLQENLVIQAYFTLFSLTSLSTSLYMISVATTASKLQELLEKVFPLLYH